jgi:mitogen-activated protein kinase organizer 1
MNMSISTFPSQELCTLRGHIGSVSTVKFNSDGNYCLSGGNDKTIRLWNPVKGTLIKTYAVRTPKFFITRPIQ